MLDNIDAYINMVDRVFVPDQFREPINVIYPPDNVQAFEEWLCYNFSGCNTDRLFLPVNWTAFYVNHNYGNDKEAIRSLQDFISTLDKTKKYWTCVQYDDSILNDVSGLNLLRFEMSKNIGVQIPLMCQPHPYKFETEKKYLVSFVVSRTHPCRNGIEKYVNKEGWYISYEPHSIEKYCQILHESIFVLCPRGYGLASFRCSEAMQYGAIPIYISDEFVQPLGLDFNEYGILVNSEDVSSLAMRLSMLSDEEVVKKQMKVKEIYEEYYTYEGCFKNITKHIEAEYHIRK
jgi:Exostosin family